MARYNGAIWRPLGRNTGTLNPMILCLHTMVGYLKSTDSYFRSVSVFSHFGIGGKWGSDVAAGLDGAIYQWGDTALRAAANLDGNPYIISVETADNAARPIQPWTPNQEDAIVDLMVWVHRTHGIPLVMVPDSKYGRRGIAYHRLGCDPYRAAGGDAWSSAYGKDCPTDPRIARVPVLIERARNIVNVNGGATPAPTTEGFLMALSDAEQAQLQADVRTLRSDVDQLQVLGAKLDRRTNYSHAVLMHLAAKVGAPVPAYDMRTDTGYPAPGDLETVGEEVARLAVDPGELTAALTRALSDLPDVDLTTDAITRVAQSTATLLSDPADPADPKAV